LVFTGTYEHSIDAKHRLAIPSEIRLLLQRAAEARSHKPATHVYVTLGEGQALCLYSEEDFEKRAADLDHSQLEPEDLLAYERLMYSLARRVDLDKQGRVRLPENLLSLAQLGADVVLIGVKDHLEIRDRGAWQRHVQQTLAQHPNLLVNPRRAMHRKEPGDAPPA
jgi:MraZ protein